MKSEMKTEMIHALQCLYIAVPEDVAKDVGTKVMNYVTELEEKLKEKEEFIDKAFEEWAENDTRIEEMLEPILGKEFIEGDTYCVPGPVCCVEELVKMYNNLKELHTLNFMSDMPPMEKLQKQRDDLKDRVKMLENIIAKHTSIPKAVIPKLTTDFPEIVQSEITPVQEEPKKECQHWRCYAVTNKAGNKDLICSDCDSFIETVLSQENRDSLDEFCWNEMKENMIDTSS